MLVRIPVASLLPWRASGDLETARREGERLGQRQTALVQMLALSLTRCVTLNKLHCLTFLSLSLRVSKVVINANLIGCT